VVGEHESALAGFDDQRAEHFPQIAGDAEAIACLESLEERDVQFLVIPHSAFGWLDLHPDFAKRLRESHRLVTRQQYACEIYELVPAAAVAEASAVSRGRRWRFRPWRRRTEEPDG